MRDHYDDETYCQAVERACCKAGVPKWTPGQLRHNAGTKIRRKYGIEAARLVLGHQSASTTEIYAEKDAEEAARIKELISETLEKVRGMSRGLSPIDIGFGGLREALQELAQNTEKRFGIPCEFELRGPLPMWDDDDALHLYWIMHEAASNAGRHSQAKRIRIEVDSAPGATELRVIDDGVSLPPDAAPGLGTRTMRHHAGIIGAALDITGTPGQGTAVTCRLKGRRPRP